MKLSVPVTIDVPDNATVGQVLNVLRAMRVRALVAGASEIELPSTIGEILAARKARS